MELTRNQGVEEHLNSLAYAMKKLVFRFFQHRGYCQTFVIHHLLQLTV